MGLRTLLRLTYLMQYLLSLGLVYISLSLIHLSLLLIHNILLPKSVGIDYILFFSCILVQLLYGTCITILCVMNYLCY